MPDSIVIGAALAHRLGYGGHAWALLQYIVGFRELGFDVTVLDRLEKRGGVTRKKRGRSFIYAPKLSRETLRRYAVKELVDAFFDGSDEALLRFLQGQPATRGAASGEGLDAALL